MPSYLFIGRRYKPTSVTSLSQYAIFNRRLWTFSNKSVENGPIKNGRHSPEPCF